MMSKKETILKKDIEEQEMLKNNELKKIEVMQSLEKQLKHSEEKLLETKNTAEKEIINILNRSNQECEKYRKFSLEKLLIEFLPISDSIERALDLIEKSEINEIFIEIKKKLIIVFDLLKDFFMFFHVKKIDNTDVFFNPSIHEAMSLQYTNDIAPNKIVKIMQTGYILHKSRLLRPAMVVVSKKKI